MNIGQELSTFSDQIRYALDHYQNHEIDRDELNAILIAGMGTAGVAGSIVKNYFNDKIPVPVEVVRNYSLPLYAGKNTLVILCSYSGNTEETLSAYNIAREKGCKIIVITAGGALLEQARKDENLSYIIEPGLQARMALGGHLTYLFQILFELLGVYKNADLLKIADFVGNTGDYKHRSAELLQPFKETLHHPFMVVCDPWFEGVATRFCQQIQENVKLEAWVSVLPEGNHNATESITGKPASNVIFLNSRLNHRTNLRLSFVKDLLKKYKIPSAEVLVKDASINTLYHVICVLDWLSFQVAEAIGADPGASPNRTALKEFLK